MRAPVLLLQHLKSLLFTLILAALVAPGLSAQGAQDFTLINKTGVDIFFVYISPHDTDDWEEDILGKDVLLNGEEVEIVFDRNETAALWDLMIMDEEENEIVWDNLNLLKIISITLYYDAATGRAWAETEEVGDEHPRRDTAQTR